MEGLTFGQNFRDCSIVYMRAVHVSSAVASQQLRRLLMSVGLAVAGQHSQMALARTVAVADLFSKIISPGQENATASAQRKLAKSD